MPSKPIKLVISNIVTLNPGDGAILEGMVSLLKEKYGSDAEITVFDNKSESAHKYFPQYTFRQSMFFGINDRTFPASFLKKLGYGHWNIRFRYLLTRCVLLLLKAKLTPVAKLIANRELVESVSTYKDADLILSTGGTYLIENYDLSPAIHDYRLSMATGNPLVFFTQTLGPFTRQRNINAFRKIFNYASAILIRDEKSNTHLTDIGVSAEKLAIVKDAAFVLPSDVETKKKGPGLSIAISVRELKFFDDGKGNRAEAYRRAIIEATTYLVHTLNAKVTFLSTCQGIAEYWTDDAQFAESLVADLAEDVKASVNVDNAFRQPIDVMRAYGRFDLLIATRMHAAILAINSAIPTIGIAYEFKIEELYCQLGLDELLVQVESINSERLISCIKSYIKSDTEWEVVFDRLSSETNTGARKALDYLPTL